MTQRAGYNDLQQYLLAWASMMITIWEEKLIMLDVNDTWELYNSLISHIIVHSGGDGAKIEFAFRKYGIYVNEGSGGEMYYDNPGMVDSARIEKPWFDKGFFKSIYALRRDVARIYGEIAAQNIVFNLKNTI